MINYHQSEIRLALLVMWSMAALGCNRRDPYLEMIHVDGAHTTSEEVSSAIAPLANIVPVQPATDEDSVDSDEGERRAVACIAKEEDKIREKERRISAANEEKSNKESFRNTLRQQSVVALRKKGRIPRM